MHQLARLAAKWIGSIATFVIGDILDGFYALLIGEWCASDDMYQYWQKAFGKGPEWILKKAAMVHFIADWKPWDRTAEGLKRKCPDSQPQLQWWEAKANVC